MAHYIKIALKQLAKLHTIPYWIFLILLIISVSTSVVALRHNNETMINLRGQLYVADKDNGDINTALNNLRSYVYSHMNTNLSSGGDSIKPPIQLKYTYQRLQAATQAASSNSGLYSQAEASCENGANNSTPLRGTTVPCVENYITSHGGAPTTAIPVALYQFDFVSPSWSPDLAGWSLVASVILFIGLVVSYLSERLRRHKK